MVIITENMYDRNITSENVFEDVNWAEVVANPFITDTKNDAPYMFPFEMNGPKTIKQYAVALTTLVLDIDDGCRIDEFNFDYEYYLYSTYSHSEERHKFRVIIPIKEKVPMSVYDSKWFKKFLMNMFPYNDEHTLRFGGFYLPNVARIDDYVYRAHKGPVFSFKPFKDELRKLKKKYDKIDMVKQDIRKRKSEVEFKRSVSVLGNAKVQDFLSGAYRERGGNLPFYTALCVAKVSGDVKTRDIIIEEAMMGGWSDREIERKLKDSGW